MSTHTGSPPVVFGTSRFVTRRARSQIGVLLTATVTALAVATLLVLAVVLPPRVAGTTFQHTVAEAPENHVIRASMGYDVDVWAVADRSVTDAVAESRLPIEVTATTWSPLVTAPQLPDRTNIVVGSMTNVDDRAELVEGRWPEPGAALPEVVVHERAVEQIGVEVGDELTIDSTTADATQNTTVVGIYRPNDPDNPVWREYGHGVIPGSSQQVTLLGPVLAPQSDYIDKLALASGTASWTMWLDVSKVEFSDSDRARAAVSQVESTVDGLDDGSMNVLSRVRDHLDRAHIAATSARAVLLGAVTMLAVLAIWALTFTARLVAARRSAATALLRARGVSPARLIVWSVLGGLMFASAVIVAAPALATLATGWLTSTGSLDDVGSPPIADPAAWLVAVLAGLGWLALLVSIDYSMGRSMASVAMEHARPPRRAAVQRAGLDVVALALAALGLQQLRRPAGEAPDAILILAPAVIVLAGALILIRTLPWIGRITSLVTTRFRAFAPGLGTLDIARRPLRHGAAAVLLVLALAVSIVTSATNTTWRDFQRDVIDLAEPADARVMAGLEADPAAVTDELSALDDVSGVTPVTRMTVPDGDIDSDLLIMDVDNARDVLRDPDEAAPTFAAAGAEEKTAVVTQSYADFFGYAVGDEVWLPVGADPVPFTIGAVTPSIPGTVNEYAVLIDQNTITAGPTEWWIDTVDGQAPQGATEIEGVASVTSHAQALERNTTDPATTAVLDALTGALGFTAIFLLIGSVVQAVSSYRARADEHAQLRAMGFTGGGTLTAIAIEHALLLAFAVTTGIGLGAFVAWLTVPHTVGGLVGLPAVPPLVFSLPWTVAGVLAAALAALLVVVVALATAGLRRVDIVGVLRAGSE